jgi:hypothetical protein
MIEALLVAFICFDLFMLGWLAHLPPSDHSPKDCCIGLPDIPDTPDELLVLTKRGT